jgi:SPP1 gp7 family putative phage head morphogenesis protein
MRLVEVAIVDNDAFGLGAPRVLRRRQLPAVSTELSPGAFAFATDVEKLEAFDNWLEERIDSGVLEITSEGGAFTDDFIGKAYGEGSKRAIAEVQAAGGVVTPIDVSLAQRVPAERVAGLYARTYNELRGLTDDMRNKMRRELAEGIATGQSPKQVARQMRKVVDISAKRAMTIARTETVRAHHAGNIAEMKRMGIEEIEVRAEWKTAGDDRVCASCAGLEGRVFKVEQIEGLIPLHPNCRCVAIPLVKGGAPPIGRPEGFDPSRTTDGKPRKGGGLYEKATDGAKKPSFEWKGQDPVLNVAKKYAHISFVPPKGAKEAADKALRWKEEHGKAVRGGTAIGWARAGQLSRRDTLSPDTVRRMKAFFDRHEKNKAINPEYRDEPWRDNGYVAWLIWGGDAGRRWAEKVVGQMRAADDAAKANAELTEAVARVSDENREVLALVARIVEQTLTANAELLAPQDGKRGARGFVGPKGDAGEVGERGRDGERGERGETGRSGLRGLQGEKGDDGKRGRRGPIGMRGKDGPRGKQGRRGADGKDGLSPDHEIKFNDDGKAVGVRFQRATGEWGEWLHLLAEDVPLPREPSGIVDVEIQRRSMRFRLSNGDWTRWVRFGGGGGGGIADAPKDGNIYARQDGEWVVVPTGGQWKKEEFVITQTDITNGFITLAATPATDSEIIVQNGVTLNAFRDYSLAGATLTWNRRPRPGHVFYIKYQ